jgi:hypothetical protein
MSRAINIDATPADVTTRLAKLNAPFTAMEALRSGGTRVVMKNADDAVAVAKAFGAKVNTGAVVRQPSRLMHHSQPEPTAAASRGRWAD